MSIEETTIVKMTDEDTLAIIDTETGEILGVEDAPETTTDLQFVEWFGNRRTRALAKKAGLEAEKAEWYSKIGRQYDGEIKCLDNFVEYLDKAYTPMLEYYAKVVLEGKKTKTLKLGFLELSFRTTRPRLDVVDNEKAVAFCEKFSLSNAIKIVKSVLKSEIPTDIKNNLVAEKQDETGLLFYAGGEEEFHIN